MAEKSASTSSSPAGPGASCLASVRGATEGAKGTGPIIIGAEDAFVTAGARLAKNSSRIPADAGLKRKTRQNRIAFT